MSFEDALDQVNPENHLWRIVINPGGSLTFLNKKNANNVLWFHDTMEINVFDKSDKNERFYVR